MSVKPLYHAIGACISAGVPAHIIGGPGEAKTALLTEWGGQLGRQTEVIVGSVRDKGDFMGLPTEADTGEVVYAPPAWVRRLQSAKRGLLVLDELQSNSETFGIAMRIVQEREVGEAQLPDGCSIVAISNPVDVAVDGMELPAPVANRFIHLDWSFDFESWSDGLLYGFDNVTPTDIMRGLAHDTEGNRKRLAALVVAFLSNAPQHRSGAPTDPSLAGKGWPSPRSWTNFVNAASHLNWNDTAARYLLLVGAVGEATAREFTAYAAAFDLADPDAVLDNPSIVDWAKERPDRLVALITGVRSLVGNEPDAETWRKAMNVMITCARAGRPDVALSTARRLIPLAPLGEPLPADLSVFDGLLEAVGDKARKRI